MFKPKEKLLKYSNVEEFTSDGKKYNSGIHFEVSPSQTEAWIKLFNRELISIKGTHELSPEKQITDTTVGIYGLSTYVTHSEFINQNTYHYTAYRKDKPNDKFTVHSSFVVGKLADYTADIVRNGKKYNLVHMSVKLDDANFLKSDYDVKFDNVKEQLYEPLKENLKQGVEKQKQLAETVSQEAVQISKNFGEKTKNSVPKLSNTRNYYQSEADKIKQEIAADKTIQRVSEFL